MGNKIKFIFPQKINVIWLPPDIRYVDKPVI